MDTVIGRYANRINGVTDFVITKLDVLTGFEKVPVCVAYEVDGVRHDEMPVNQSDFHHAKPVYELLDGWWEDISGCREFDDLPAAAQAYVLRVEELDRGAGLGDRRRPGPARDHPALPAARLTTTFSPGAATFTFAPERCGHQNRCGAKVKVPASGGKVETDAGWRSRMPDAARSGADPAAHHPAPLGDPSVALEPELLEQVLGTGVEVGAALRVAAPRPARGRPRPARHRPPRWR